MYVCKPHVCLVTPEARGRHRILWNLSYRSLWATTLVLRIESWSSRRTASVLSLWGFSLENLNSFFFLSPPCSLKQIILCNPGWLGVHLGSSGLFQIEALEPILSWRWNKSEKDINSKSKMVSWNPGAKKRTDVGSLSGIMSIPNAKF